MIRKNLEKIRQSIWLYPAIYSIFSLLGALLVLQIDFGFLVNYQESIPSIFLTSTDLARTIHGIIAGAFITITTFTFSITMVVLTMYMSQLSPRVVENFLTQKNTMQSFGVFVGGFTYSIVSLLFTRSTIEEYTVISASIGVVYIGVGLVYFVIFINNVATFIQTGNVIDRLSNESKGKIATYKALLETHPVVSRPRVEDYEGSFSIYCEKNGYIQQIQDRKLFDMVDKKKLVVVFQKVVGQYITQGEALFTVYYSEKTDEVQSMADGIRNLVSIGDHKTEKQDFAYTIQKMVEVALRSLSPGINDPFTAIQCIRNIGESMALLSNEKYGYIKVDDDPEEAGYVLLEAYRFELMMHDAFDQIVHYGNSDIKVMRAVLHALQLLERKSIEENKPEILAYREYLQRKIEGNHFDEFEIKTIKQEYLS